MMSSETKLYLLKEWKPDLLDDVMKVSDRAQTENISLEEVIDMVNVTWDEIKQLRELDKDGKR